MNSAPGFSTRTPVLILVDEDDASRRDVDGREEERLEYEGAGGKRDEPRIRGVEVGMSLARGKSVGTRLAKSRR